MTWPQHTGHVPSPPSDEDRFHDEPGLLSASGPPTSQDFRDVHVKREQQNPDCVGCSTMQTIQDLDLQLLALDAPIIVQRVDGSTYRTTRKQFNGGQPLDLLAIAWPWTLGRILALNDMGVPVRKDVGLPVGGTNFRYALEGLRDQFGRAEADWPDDPTRATFVPDAIAAEAEPLFRIPDKAWYRIKRTSADDVLAAFSAALEAFGKGQGSKPLVAFPVGPGFASTPEDGTYQRDPRDVEGHAQEVGAVDIPGRKFWVHWSWPGSRGEWIPIDTYMAIATEDPWVVISIVYMEKVK